MNNQIRLGKRILLFVLTAATLLAISRSWSVLAQEGGWTTPTVVSVPEQWSWFPDLAVDPFGSVHIVWCLTIPLGGRRGLQEQVSYTRWDRGGEDWLPPNDIIPISADIVRNAIATDLIGNVHLLFGGSVYDGFTLYHQKAPVGQAWSAAKWSMPHRINQGISYMGDMAVDSQGVIHVIYDDTIRHTSEDDLTLADVFYRRSDDGGRKWSAPIRLDPGPLTGSARPYLEIDTSDVIHVTWDEGWDRLTGEHSDTYYGFYISSADGGETWTSPMVIDYPEALVVQSTVGSDGQGGVMLVWRATVRDDVSYDELFYQWSPDGGRSWGEPSVILGLFSRPWTGPFDMYDMATDSAGNIHLVAVGRESRERETLLGVYHLVWDGESWASPTRIFAEEGFQPEYPKIVVHEGNQLHAVWFTREGSEWDSEANRDVWYASSQSLTPHQPVTPLPTPTPTPLPTLTPSPTSMVTPYPTASLESTGLPAGLYTESDDVFRLAIALSPIVLVILVVMAIRMKLFRNLRR